MDPHLETLQQQTRRHFLRSAGQFSVGAIALEALLGQTSASASVGNPFASKPAPAPA